MQLVACLCAAWCRTCDGYAPLLETAKAEFSATHPALRWRWIDIEDESELVGDYDVETFPTLLILDDSTVRFAGPVTPQPETLRRLLRSALAGDAGVVPQPPEVEALAARLRRAGD